MAIRPARPHDAPAVAEIRIAGWQGYAGLLDPAYVTGDGFAHQARTGAATWLADVDERGWSPSGATLLVHETDGSVDGWVSFGTDRDDPTRGEVWGLYVAPTAWGSGTAAQLLGTATEHLKGQGFAELVLWCLEGNDRALRFYQREGWHLDGTRQQRDFGPAGAAIELRLTRA
jgi:GNAT superfamily N-acetyltransferase